MKRVAVKRAAWLGFAFATALRAPATAQQAGKTYRIRVLVAGTPNPAYTAALVHALAGLGYRQDQNLDVVLRSANSELAQLPALASEVVRAKPDVIVASGFPTVAALKRVTASIPIVILNVSDPVRFGLVASLARPGGNITGLTNIAVQLEGKQLQLLTELVPNIRRVGFLEDLNNPANLNQARQFEVACRRLRMDGASLGFRSAAEVDVILRNVPQRHLDALVVAVDSLLFSSGRRIVEGLSAQRLPAIYGASDFPEVGGLVSYGPSILGQWVQVATYVARILKGAKPADLPVQQPTTFDLVVNLTTAKALGLTVPQSILLQATRVIR